MAYPIRSRDPTPAHSRKNNTHTQAARDDSSAAGHPDPQAGAQKTARGLRRGRSDERDAATRRFATQ